MTASGGDEARPFTAFIIAGEESGDQLGAGLMRALADRLGGNVRFLGVGGARMAALGLKSMFPMQDIGLHGIATVIPSLGRLFVRRRQLVQAILAAEPDVLITIDCPSFNIGVTRLVRAADPSITNIHYVMPSVWAWRPGRARKMARSIDHVLALLPFEPQVSRELGGPPCTYVGHLLIERVDLLRPGPGERPAIGATKKPTLVVLPGSRRSETDRLLQPFGEAVARIAAIHGPVEVVIPAVTHLLGEIRAGVAKWAVQPTIVEGEEAKFAAFRRAHAALAASGTVTLELALAGVPMVVAYRIDLFVQWIRLVFRARSIVLSNLILDENVIPELIDWQTTPKRLAATVAPLLTDSPERAAQLAAFAKLDALMRLDGTTPNVRAAEVVLETVAARQRRLESGT